MTPSFAEFTRTWARIGCLSFGGPAGQIALMQRVLIDEKGWIDAPRYLQALNVCMLLPGPEAHQLATWCGWRMFGLRGALVAGSLFVLPGALVMLVLSWAYLSFGALPVVAAALLGLKAVVVAIVLDALMRVAKRALTERWHWAIAALAFMSLFALQVPFPIVIAVAGLAGALLASPAPMLAADPAPPQWRPLRTLAIGLAVWLGPVLIVTLWLGPEHSVSQVARFFAQLAVVTFGGAYAVLSAVTQAAVDYYGWLTTPEMITGLGLAETTPGPLVLVLQFVGTLAGYRDAAPLSPWVGALLGAALTLWVTFVPSILWILLAGPVLDRMHRLPHLAGALHGITAAVVGVILNLSLWFALHVAFAKLGTVNVGPATLLAPDLASVRPMLLGMSALAAIALIRFKLGLGWVLAGGLALGALLLSPG
jgi:chromate transporter